MRPLRTLRLTLTAAALGVAAGLACAASAWQMPGRWVDDQGHVFDIPSLQGQPAIVTMAYGACRRVCSTSLRLMKDLQARADQRGLAIRFVVVGLDPKSDRPDDWALWRRENGLQRDNWTFLTGDEFGTRAMARRLGMRYWRYGDHTMHDLRIVYFSPDAQVLRAIEHADQGPDALLP